MPRRGIGEFRVPRTEKEPLPDVASSNPWAVESIPEAMDGTAKPAAEDFYPICPKGTITTIISVAIPKSVCWRKMHLLLPGRFLFTSSSWTAACSTKLRDDSFSQDGVQEKPIPVAEKIESVKEIIHLDHTTA
jgi:hypothetical protein